MQKFLKCLAGAVLAGAFLWSAFSIDLQDDADIMGPPPMNVGTPLTAVFEIPGPHGSPITVASIEA